MGVFHIFHVIQAIAQALKDIAPRELPKADSSLTLSGLDNIAVNASGKGFTPIGERTNVAAEHADVVAAMQQCLDQEKAKGMNEETKYVKKK